MPETLPSCPDTLAPSMVERSTSRAYIPNDVPGGWALTFQGLERVAILAGIGVALSAIMIFLDDRKHQNPIVLSFYAFTATFAVWVIHTFLFRVRRSLLTALLVPGTLIGYGGLGIYLWK